MEELMGTVQELSRHEGESRIYNDRKVMGNYRIRD